MSDDGNDSLIDKIKDVVHKRTSSSSSDDNETHHDLNILSHSTKKRLFGRQKPVHALFGGGKSADILLWRNKQFTGSMFAGGTVIWLLFEWIGYHLLTFVCHSLILTLAVLFLWSNFSSFVNKSPLNLPDVTLPEETFMSIALMLREQFHQAFTVFREIAAGNDLKQFLYVPLLFFNHFIMRKLAGAPHVLLLVCICTPTFSFVCTNTPPLINFVKVILGLWIISIVGGWFNFLTLVYLLFVMALTLPFVYEMHEDQVDSYADMALIELKKQYSVLDEKYMRKLPKIPFLNDHKQH